jgi:hypothetical protein
MSGAVSRETQLQRFEAAMAYAGWNLAKLFRMRRHYGRKVDLIEFILAWRDEESCEAIADRFDLADADYVSELRAKLGLPARGHGGPRAKGVPVSREFLAKFAKRGGATP